MMQSFMDELTQLPHSTLGLGFDRVKPVAGAPSRNHSSHAVAAFIVLPEVVDPSIPSRCHCSR